MKGLLAMLQIAICLVAFLGIVNVSIVTAYDREQEYNIYKFSGMSEKGYLLHALGESVIIGMSGAAIGAVICVCVYQMMPALAIAAEKYMVFAAINVKLAVVLSACFVLFGLLWYSIACRGRRRFNLMRSQNERLI